VSRDLDLGSVSLLALLSPHLDDVVLSCAALIADARRRGIDVLVITLFNGRPEPPLSPPAVRFHARCGHAYDNAMDEREHEDDLALGRLGARTVRLYLPEALYRKNRRGEPVYDSDASIFLERLPQPCAFLDTVRRKVRAAVDVADPDLLLVPLGIGGHIDHMLAREAVRELSYPIMHYEDVPYLLYDRCKNWSSTMPLHDARMHHVTKAGWSAKLEAIDCYASQREVLWYSPSTWRDDLTGYAMDIGAGCLAERYWAWHGR
jgi:LmbE family N-acetylglucosaminyl deacetylase